MSNRHALMWFRWLHIQWNTPSRSDYYLMQIAAEIRRGNLERGQRVAVDDMKLTFKSSNEKQDTTSTGDRAALMKSMWMGRVGGKVKGWGKGGQS